MPSSVLARATSLSALIAGIRSLIAFLMIVTASARGAESPSDTTRREFFEAKIRPVLAAQCYSCHGALKQKGGLRVDSRDALRRGGDSGPAIEPGKPEGSLLVQVLEHSEPGLEMPKDAARLPESVVREVRAWIAEGAFDPRDKPPTPEESATAEWSAKLAERRSWWSLQPLSRPPVPQTRSRDWPADPVDSFILSRLEREGLAPALPAEPVVLARRLSFVLTGLPPRWDDVQAFAANPSPVGYERLVDRLLASPSFGEHWARHWMDVARYTDTYGYEWDIPAKGAWRYRDYLTRAFNADIPFDQLAREQIAGDLLPHPRINPTEAINESLIGPMFYQLGEKRHGDSAMFDGIHQEMLHNKIDAFSKAFLGLTVGCARCHDHKRDAVSQRDYYALAGAFMSPRWVTNTLDTPVRNAAVLAELRRLKKPLRDAIGSWWRERSQSWESQLLAAPGSTPNAWQKAVAAVKGEPPLEHLLRPWIALSKVCRDGGDLPAAWQQLKAQYAGEQERRREHNAKMFRAVADFRTGVPAGWSVDGVGLRDGPVRCGDFTVALEGTSSVGRILPGGLFTHSLSPRLNGAVRTPYLSGVGGQRISLEACGGDFSAERIVIDNAFLSERQAYLAQKDPAWRTQSTFADLTPRRVFIELATKTSNPNFPPRVGLGGACSEAQVADPRSWLGITRAIVHDQDGTPQDELSRFQSFFDRPEPKTLAELAGSYTAWWRAALERWAHDEATEDDVRVLNWLLDRTLLPNDESAPGVVRDLVAGYRRIEQQVLDPETVNGLADLDEGYDYRLNVRGEYDQLGAPVPRGYVGALETNAEASVFHSARSGRLELAERTVAAENPLTARVYVNRVWQWVFGVGIVATPDDLGRLGDAPTHPELLDHLAGSFIANGWSTKHLVRRLVMSATFRQGSVPSGRARNVDPRDRLLHHYPLRRLEAESVRDAILSASGQLDSRLYGTPINPHRPKEDPEKRLFSGPIDGQGRRSVYLKVTIMEPPKFLATFNQPPPKLPLGRRDVTNVPAQALALLNDPFVLEQAKLWGERIAGGAIGSVPTRLSSMFQSALGREPSSEEIAAWQSLVTDLAQEQHIAPEAILSSAALWADVAHTFFNTKEFLYLR